MMRERPDLAPPIKRPPQLHKIYVQSLTDKQPRPKGPGWKRLGVKRTKRMGRVKTARGWITRWLPWRYATWRKAR